MFKKFATWWAAIKVLIFNVDPETALHVEQAEDAAAYRIKQAVAFVEALKTLVGNPLFDFLTTITPMGWDDDFLRRARKGIEVVLREMRELDGLLAVEGQHPGIGTTLTAQRAAQVLTQLPKERQHIFYHKLAAYLAADKRNKTGIAKATEQVQAYYTETFKPTLQAATLEDPSKQSVFVDPHTTTNA